jgi:hypothetical protein
LAIIALVTPDGSVRQVAGDVAFPNGMVVTPDNPTLIIARVVGQPAAVREPGRVAAEDTQRAGLADGGMPRTRRRLAVRPDAPRHRRGQASRREVSQAPPSTSPVPSSATGATRSPRKATPSAIATTGMK